MLVGAAAAVLVGVAIMLFVGGKLYENRLNDSVERVTRDFDTSLKRFQDDVRKELDARLPASGASPAPTPFTPTDPLPTETPSPEFTPPPEATETPFGEASPTETPREEIRP